MIHRPVALVSILAALILLPSCHPPPARPGPPAPAPYVEPPPPTVEDRPVKALVGGTVIHTNLARPGAPPALANATVLIEGDRIKAVGPAATVKVPPGAQIIDARGKYIIPGLVDGHIHFFQSGGLYTRPDGLDLRKRVPYGEEIRRIRRRMGDLFRRYLRCGVTTVVDVGGPMWNFEVRDRARREKTAPRVFVTGPLIASYQPPQLDHPDLPIIRVTDAAGALALARKQIARKADLIKIWYVVSKKAALNPAAFFPVAKAVADEAHKHNLPVFIHATELATAKLAMRAGADVLVHSVVDREIDEEFIRMAKARKVIVVPTLWVFSSYAAVYTKQLKLMTAEHMRGDPRVIATLYQMHQLADAELGERQRKLQAANKPIATSPILLENLRRMHRGGVTVALGTDAGNVGVLHGPAVYHEMAIMAQAGLTPHQILVDATLHGARLVGKDSELGSVEAGKLADLVVLDADPLRDVLNTTRVRWVLKGGHLFHPELLVPRTAEALAQIQLNAYNARQLEPFLAVYSPDVEVYQFPDRLMFKGKEKMRQRYAAFFAKANKLHARLVGRVRRGRFVVDQEDVVTGIPGRERLRALAIYEVRAGLIHKVWFIK